jgi:hypothetical protein
VALMADSRSERIRISRRFMRPVYSPIGHRGQAFTIHVLKSHHDSTKIGLQGLRS